MRFASGDRLGPFEIVAPLGSGGMGEVYRARDARLDRTVALKLLPSELVEAGSRVQRFRQEARAVARLSHPNICGLYDVGEDGAALFLIMEYLDGATLAARLEDGPLPLPLALRTAAAIADALAHAHRQGVVHRDLKPANIMLTRDGVKLLDFGLATLKDRDEQLPADPTQSARLTDAGTIVGTAPYMAPEQIEGRDVDARTDIFAFGIVLYQMVSGRLPFVGDSRASLMAAIVAAEPAPLADGSPPVPAPLERLIRRCLAKDPEERWQTARDLTSELRWIADAEPGEVWRVAVRRWRPRRQALLGAVVGAAFAASAAAAIVASLWPEPGVAAFYPVTYRKGIVSSARFSPDGQSFVYSASWEGQPYATFLGRRASPDARDLQLNDSRILSISRGGDMAVLFGPQNVQRAFGTRTLARIPMAGGARRDLLTGVVDADWIPNADALAVIRDPGEGRPWVVEFPIGTPVHEARAAWSLRVSPDGNRVAFFEGPMVFDSRPNAMVTVIDKAGAKTTVARNVVGLGLAWPPSGNEVWFTGTRPGQHAPQLLATSLAGVERAVHRAPDWLVLHDIAPDGRVLLSRNTIRMTLECKRPGDTRPRDLTWLLGSSALGLSADGETVYFSEPLGADPDLKLPMFRRRVDGSPAVSLGDGQGGAVSPDGRWLLTSSGQHLVVLPTGAGSPITLPNGALRRFGGGSWLGDSKRIVFTADMGAGAPRGYIQDIAAGLPREITASGVVLANKAAVRDDHTLLARSGGRWVIVPLEGGEGRPVPALTPRDIPLQWSNDGRYLYTVDAIDPAASRPAGVEVRRVELATGNRTIWNTLAPSDPTGVEDMRATVTITRDGHWYCYSYMRRLGDLFVVEGLE